MALRSAVAPLLTLILAWPARVDAAAPALTAVAPTRAPTSAARTTPEGREATGPVAVPEPGAAASDAEASAEALYNAGEQAYWLGDFRRAVDLFEAAYARSGLPALLYNVGLATMRRYELSEDPEDLRRARAVLTNYAQELRKDPTLQQADNVPRLIAQLDADLADLAARKPAPVEPAPTIGPTDAPAEVRCEPAPAPTPAPDTRRAGAALMTLGGLTLAGGVATTLTFALKGQSFQRQQEALLADAAARGCAGAPSSPACVALTQARAVTVDNGRRANLLAGGLGGGLMALGVAGLVVGAVLFTRTAAPRTRLALTPAFTTRSVGLALSGRF